MMAQNYCQSAEYNEWYASVARRFLSVDRILRDLKQFELPNDVPVNVPSIAGVPRLTCMPDQWYWERRLCIRTRASRRQHVVKLEHDEDGTNDEDCSSSQPYPSPNNLPSPYMTEHAESSHRYMVENASSPLNSGSLSSGSTTFTNFQAKLQACLNGPSILAASTHQQTCIEETVMYQTNIRLLPTIIGPIRYESQCDNHDG